MSEFEGLEGVVKLDMGESNIHEIRGSPFDELSDLSELFLNRNELTDESMVEGLSGIPQLVLLVLTENNLQKVPNFNVTAYPYLEDLFLAHNNISTLSREDLSGMSKLRVLNLFGNPIVGFSQENEDIFKGTPILSTLDLDDTHVSRPPNMKYLPKLKFLFLNNARLTALPNDLCCTCADLVLLEAKGNLLQDVPLLNCTKLVDVDFSRNRIKTISSNMVRGLHNLKTLDLNDNLIEELDYNMFNESVRMHFLYIRGNRIKELPDLSGMHLLVKLDASFNQITDIKRETFISQVKMDTLLLNDNKIKSIDPKAFSLRSDLKTLSLSRNRELSEWVLPLGGFPNLAVLNLEELWNLYQVPSISEIQRANELYFTYSYHCCIWKDHVAQLSTESNVRVDENEIFDQIITETTPPVPTLPPIITNCSELMDNLKRDFNKTGVIDEDCDFIPIDDSQNNSGNFIVNKEFVIYVGPDIDIRIDLTKDVKCMPMENPLSPCQNLMDPWPLRISIWTVWVLTLLGNGTVLFVGIAARKKLEASDILICNLAFADFCMGLYLVFLSIVDIRTFGSFFQSALDWQQGPGCVSAGFIAVFSNELSLYILVILTLERVYTVVFPFKENEKKKKKTIIGLCVGGWIAAALVASLPIVGINSFNHVDVCLPYLTERWFDRVYVGFLLTCKLVGFFIILFSYVYIFYNACKSTPATHMLQQRKGIIFTASRVAVLIVIAFLCWAPTALIGYLALLGIPLVSAAQAKYLVVFVLPLNACINPFIYAIFTWRFRNMFTSIFQKPNDKNTTFPLNPGMRLQRTEGAFTSDFTMSSGVNSTVSSKQDELTRLRQKRRSNSLVVQYLDKNISTPSPNFTPPVGCNLERRASLPLSFGSTLKSSRASHHTPHSVLTFSSHFSSNTSSLGDLPEEGAIERDLDARLHPLTCSDESNLKRLSIVVEDEDELDVPTISHGKPCEEDAFSNSSSEDYSDASDTFSRERETDLDLCMHGSAHLELEVRQPVMPSTDEMLEGGADLNIVMHSCGNSNKEVELQPLTQSSGDMINAGTQEYMTKKTGKESLAIHEILEAAAPPLKCSDILLSAGPCPDLAVCKGTIGSQSSKEKLVVIPEPSSICPSFDNTADTSDRTTDPSSPPNLHHQTSSHKAALDINIYSIKRQEPTVPVSEVSTTAEEGNASQQECVLGFTLKSSFQENTTKKSTIIDEHLTASSSCSELETDL